MHQHHQHHHAKRNGLEDIKDFVDGLLGRDNDNHKGGSNDEPVVVYKTVAPTFDGPVGGYKTGDGDDTPQKTSDAPMLGPPVQHTPAPDPTTTQKEETKPTEKVETTEKPKAEPTETSSENKVESSNQPKPTSESTLVQSPSVSATPSSSTPTGIDDASLASSSPSPTMAAESSGMSAGAKAGIAIGVIAVVGLVALGALFFIRKRKRERDIVEPDNEKSFTAAAPPPPSNPTPPPMQTTPTTAPQLNLRPVTQFSPDLGGNRVSSGNMLAAGAAAGAGVAAGAAANRSLTGQQNSPSVPPKHGPTGSDPFNDPVDPFGNHAAASGPTSPASPPANGVPAALQVRNPSPDAPSDGTVSPEMVATGVAATGTAVAAGAVAVRNSKSGKDPVPTVEAPPKGLLRDGAPPSPAISDTVSVSSTTAGAIAAGGGPGPNNVYRVQLDFSPSMDDEMGLNAGQLVRLVHEYDDGWALCVRLDRSQQGVAPRTCLSARPVKPRPRGPPPGAGPRGPPPMGPPGRAMSPAGGRSSPGPGPGRGPNPNGPRFSPPGAGSRPASPNAGYKPYPPQGPPRFPPVPRSLSPGPGSRTPQQPRSMSPGPYGPGGSEKPSSPENQRRRSNSVGGTIAAANNLPEHPGTVNEPEQAPVAEKAPEQQAPQHAQQQEASQPQPASDPTPPAKQDPPEAPKSPPPSLGPVERKPVGGASQ